MPAAAPDDDSDMSPDTPTPPAAPPKRVAQPYRRSKAIVGADRTLAMKTSGPIKSERDEIRKYNSGRKTR